MEITAKLIGPLSQSADNYLSRDKIRKYFKAIEGMRGELNFARRVSLAGERNV